MTPGVNLKFKLWISLLLSEEMSGSVLLQQIPGIFVAIFFMYCSLNLTQVAPNLVFLRREYRNQLSYESRSISSWETPWMSRWTFPLEESCDDTLLALPASMGFVEAAQLGKSVFQSSSVLSSCYSIFCRENSSGNHHFGGQFMSLLFAVDL